MPKATTPHTAYAATMQSVWFCEDDGKTWNRLLTPTGGVYNESRCWSVVTHPRTPGELLTGTDQGLYRYTSHQNRFDYIPSPMDGLQIQQIARHPNDPNFIVCGTRPAEIFISEDNGGSWRRSHFDAATECWFINTTRTTCIQFDPHDADTIWVSVEIDGIFRSRDRGHTWQHLINGFTDNDTHDLVFIKRGAGRRIFCATEAGMHYSDDEAESWHYLHIPEAPWLYFRSVKTRSDNIGVIFASVADKPSGETGILLMSRDHGESWQKASLPDDVNSTLWSIGTNPADPMLVYVVSIFGQIFRSINGGETWQKLPRELGEIRMVAWTPSA
jgi:photosystem II stability/assembly factor-like uncharacterized protein